MARRNIKVTSIKSFLGGIDLDSSPFLVPEDCVIGCLNVLPALSVGGIQIINGYTIQNPNSPLASRYVTDTSADQITDTSSNLVKG